MLIKEIRTINNDIYWEFSVQNLWQFNKGTAAFQLTLAQSQKICCESLNDGLVSAPQIQIQQTCPLKEYPNLLNRLSQNTCHAVNLSHSFQIDKEKKLITIDTNLSPFKIHLHQKISDKFTLCVCVCVLIYIMSSKFVKGSSKYNTKNEPLTTYFW